MDNYGCNDCACHSKKHFDGTGHSSYKSVQKRFFKKLSFEGSLYVVFTHVASSNANLLSLKAQTQFKRNLNVIWTQFKRNLNEFNSI